MRSTRVMLALSVSAALSAAAFAQTPTAGVERRPAAKNALVEIKNPSGSVQVKGWDREEVEVKGKLGADAEQIDISGDKQHLSIKVKAKNAQSLPTADLEVSVPKGASLKVSGVKAKIDVSGVVGPVATHNVEGRVVIGGAAEAEIEAVNGDVEILEGTKRVRVKAVNGNVNVKGGRGRIEASTVNGSLSVSGTAFDEVRLNSVQGPINFEGELPQNAALSAESVGGTVTLALPAASAADFAIGTMSGTITNGLSDATPKEMMMRKSLSFTLGGGGAKVNVETLSGAISLVKR